MTDPAEKDIGAPNPDSIRDVTRYNLQRIMDEERLDAAELGRLYGTTRQNIQGFLDKGFGEKVAEQLGRALKRPWYDFYRIDFTLQDLSGVPNETVQVLVDVKTLMQRGDARLRTLFAENVGYWNSQIEQMESKKMLEDRVKFLEDLLGVDDTERIAGFAKPRSGRDRKSGSSKGEKRS